MSFPHFVYEIEYEGVDDFLPDKPRRVSGRIEAPTMASLTHYLQERFRNLPYVKLTKFELCRVTGEEWLADETELDEKGTPTKDFMKRRDWLCQVWASE